MKKLKLKVIPNGNNEYTVEIEGSTVKGICQCIKSFCSCLVRNFTRLIIMMLLVLSFIFTAFFFRDEKSNFDSDASYLAEKSVVTTKTDLQNERKITGIKFKSQSLYLLYFIIFTVTDITLLVLFVKDDSGLRYAKLEELRTIRENIDTFENSIDKKNTIVEEKTKKCAQKTTVTTTKTTSETSNRANLLKHYMDCITEI
ncbi:hypothetical protein [Treponema sp.]|uniref:hypothetical protein n=1 Tax=Treponema sp. TaxID=166 RepID=UPI0025F69E54|nr:hypothetical protein [Treponema sp.]MBR4322532.1 hypothetical protein [Treponema sp.]